MGRDDQRPPIVTRWMVILNRSAAYEIRFLPSKISIRMVGFLGRPLNVVLLHGAAVSDPRRVVHRQRVARDAYYAFYVIESRVDRISENDHVTAPRGMNGGQFTAAAGNARS